MTGSVENIVALVAAIDEVENINIRLADENLSHWFAHIRISGNIWFHEAARVMSTCSEWQPIAVETTVEFGGENVEDLLYSIRRAEILDPTLRA